MFLAIFRAIFLDTFQSCLNLAGFEKKNWFCAPRPTNEVYVLSGSGNFIQFDTVENV